MQKYENEVPLNSFWEYWRAKQLLDVFVAKKNSIGLEASEQEEHAKLLARVIQYATKGVRVSRVSANLSPA